MNSPVKYHVKSIIVILCALATISYDSVHIPG